RPLLGKPTPCVGRQQELSMLEGMLTSAVEDSASCAVVVTAAPGIGKSRLRHEFLRRVSARDDGTVILRGRGDPVLAGSTLGLMVFGILQLCEIAEEQTPAQQSARLEERFCRHVPVPDRPRVLAAMSEL